MTNIERIIEEKVIKRVKELKDFDTIQVGNLFIRKSLGYFIEINYWVWKVVWIVDDLNSLRKQLIRDYKKWILHL